MKVSDAAKKLGVSPATVRKRVQDGSLRAERIADPAAWPHGYRWEVDESSVDENVGRWRGRGRHRDRWEAENNPPRGLDVLPAPIPEPASGMSPPRTRRTVPRPPSSTEESERRPSKDTKVRGAGSDPIGSRIGALIDRVPEPWRTGSFIALGIAWAVLRESLMAKYGPGHRKSVPGYSRITTQVETWDVYDIDPVTGQRVPRRE